MAKRRSKVAEAAEAVQDYETTPKPEKEAISKICVGSGSTLLNLAITGNIDDGFPQGTVILLVGDSSSGKTFLSLTCCAEAVLKRDFDGYAFIYDDVENGCMMDVGRFFGTGVLSRLKAPRYIDNIPTHSDTAEECYMNILENIKHGPCIYIVDSLDALSSKAEEKKNTERLKARGTAAEAKIKGDYGDGKAAINSRRLRAVARAARNNGSIVVLIAQTRDNIDPFSFETRTRSGGRALKFYSHVELWSSVGGRAKQTVRGQEVIVGIRSLIRVKKNRITGREWDVEVPIYYDYGIDDIGGMIDFLIKWDHWTQNGKTISTKEFGYSGTRRNLIKHIEQEGLRRELQIIVRDIWSEIEAATKQNRKARYA